jgi:LysM repeat protein
MKRKYFLSLLITVQSITGFAQLSYNELVQKYIEQFKDLAIEEQKRTGVPAAIKLAQGIFETAAGSSELCANASNHFGIKCKTTWTGETYTYTDDAKDECFRKYSSAVKSYQDHSDFLKTNRRYASLFQISPTDYAAWAYGLKRCGYATNPQYAKKLIKTIEDFKLQEYTYAALENSEPGDVLLASAATVPANTLRKTNQRLPGEHIPVEDEQPAIQNAPRQAEVKEEMTTEITVAKAPRQQSAESGVKDYYQPATKNGRKGFYAKKGDMLLEYAIKHKIRYAKLLELNDLPDTPLEADMFIYLERKAKTGSKAFHVVSAGETMLQISQQECIQLEQLLALNKLNADEAPVAGSKLYLQTPAPAKPAVYGAPSQVKETATSATTAASGNAQAAPGRQTYVATEKQTAVQERVIDVQEEEEEEEGEAMESVVTTPAKTSTINIANEVAVEETIAAERKLRATQEPQSPSAPQTVNTQNQKDLSPLDRLKAHMDKTVYASDNSFKPKSSGNYGDRSEKNIEVAEAPVKVERQSQLSNRTTAREAAPKAGSKNKQHVVRRGETLFGIAEKYGLTVAQLQKLNKLGTSKKIVPGMKLKVAQ